MCDVQLKCCSIIPEEDSYINCNLMEKRHNVDPLDSLCVPIVVPSVVNLYIWAKQTPSSHQNPSSVILVIIKLELIVSLHCHVLCSDSRCIQSDIHQPSICSACTVNIPQLSSLAVFTLHTKVTEQSSPTWSERNSLKWGPVVVRGRRGA